MDPIYHALDHLGRDRDNLPLPLQELAEAFTKDSDALDIDTVGNFGQCSTTSRPTRGCHT